MCQQWWPALYLHQLFILRDEEAGSARAQTSCPVAQGGAGTQGLPPSSQLRATAFFWPRDSSLWGVWQHPGPQPLDTSSIPSPKFNNQKGLHISEGTHPDAKATVPRVGEGLGLLALCGCLSTWAPGEKYLPEGPLGACVPYPLPTPSSE